tara:strand:- start:1461 stop:2159 length:699 start_codon:yes stop_codon:yes gene_type:complete
MSYFIVIPARYKSSRFPGKLLEKINNESVIRHVYDRSCKSNASKIYIATDSNEIYEHCIKFSEHVHMTSTENRNGTERIAELAKNKKWSSEQLVINVQGDMPFVPSSNIDYLASCSSSSSLTTLYYPLSSNEAIENENIVKVQINTDSNKVIKFFRKYSNEDLTKTFRHIGIYSYTVKNLMSYVNYDLSINEKNLKLEQYRFLDNNFTVKAYLAKDDPGISIDTKSDIENFI